MLQKRHKTVSALYFTMQLLRLKCLEYVFAETKLLQNRARCFSRIVQDLKLTANSAKMLANIPAYEKTDYYDITTLQSMSHFVRRQTVN